MRKNIVLKSILVASLTTMMQADENCYANGVYVGVSSAFLSFGGDSLDVETFNKDGKRTNKVTYQDISSFPTEFKVGYQHYAGNRVEIYVRNNEIETDGGDIDVRTFGINYEFGFASISSGSKLLPYISLGVGTGEASSDKLKKVDDTDVAEFNIGLGMHYQVNKNLYATFGYAHDTTIFHDGKDNDNNIIEFSSAGTNTLKLGVSYHF